MFPHKLSMPYIKSLDVVSIHIKGGLFTKGNGIWSLNIHPSRLPCPLSFVSSWPLGWGRLARSNLGRINCWNNMYSICSNTAGINSLALPHAGCDRSCFIAPRGSPATCLSPAPASHLHILLTIRHAVFHLVCVKLCYWFHHYFPGSLLITRFIYLQ